jgi:Domain of unknown function (DUF3806)
VAWFGRKRDDAPTDEPQEAAEPEAVLGDDLSPVVERIGADEQARIDAALAAVQGEGVDLDDVESIGAGLDRAYLTWQSTPEPQRPDHAAVVERYALAIGEHLHRHTDLDWQLVTDVFGTDLALTEGFKGSFVVVPHNLVAGRWMRGETGWVPAVVGHLVRRRNRR